MLAFLSAFQNGVLLLRQAQEYAAAAGGDGLVQHQPALLICNPTATLYKFDHLRWRCEVKLHGQGSLQVGLEELALPAVAVPEVYVNLMKTLPKADFSGVIGLGEWVGNSSLVECEYR